MLAEQTLFLGKDLLPWLLLALGGALAVGNVLAIVRPPSSPDHGSAPRAPVKRSLAMASVGAITALWALASLLR